MKMKSLLYVMHLVTEYEQFMRTSQNLRTFSVRFCYDRPDDGGSTNLSNVGVLQRDYRAQYPRRL
jgi:hypothetical protein